MNLPRPRFGLRTLMVLVALTAALVWSGIMARRSQAYRAIAQGHSAKASYLAMLHNAGHEPMSDGTLWPQEKQVALYRGLQRKYEHAARYPWLSVEPDPELPQVVAGFDIQAMEGH